MSTKQPINPPGTSRKNRYLTNNRSSGDFLFCRIYQNVPTLSSFEFYHILYFLWKNKELTSRKL